MTWLGATPPLPAAWLAEHLGSRLLAASPVAGGCIHSAWRLEVAADPVTREVKRFLTSPKNCEVTGATSTPDGKTFFVGIQHPGEDWVG
jgi:secreted PhoX family phosphatase